MTTPRVEIDLGKIQENARFIVRRLGARGISVTGVTKAVCGHPDVARAMLNGGVVGLADARVSNVIRMQAAGIACSISMIRAPLVNEIKDVISSCDASYNTEIDTIQKLGAVARDQEAQHDIILMVEMGDLREGIMPGELVAFASRIVATPGINLKGIAANFACMGHVAPGPADMALLSRLADQVEGANGPCMALVSGGGSASLGWALGTGGTGRINNLRLGEAILLGINPVSLQPIAGLHTDAFALVAEVIEARQKPNSMPVQPRPLKYSKLEPVSTVGRRNRAVLAVGQQDTDTSGFRFPSGIAFIGATSDHTVIDTGSTDVSVGSEMKIVMNYQALMRAMSAPDVEKVVCHAPQFGDMIKGTSRQTVLKLV